MDRALVGVSGLPMWCALPNLTPVAEMAQNPRAETAGGLAQLCLLGFGLVGVAEPNRSWGAASPTPSHAGQRIPVTTVTRASGFGSQWAGRGKSPVRLLAARSRASTPAPWGQ
jgi:hypothetical protein